MGREILLSLVEWTEYVDFFYGGGNHCGVCNSVITDEMLTSHIRHHLAQGLGREWWEDD